MYYSSKEIRKNYLEFMKSKWHVIVPSSSVIPENDPTTLFTWSGMQPMIPYLLWEKHPEWTRITDSQKAFRVVDIESVWDNTHCTLFEMIWNRSFWDYYKSEQIEWIFEFRTKIVWIDPNRLYVTVYRWDPDLWINKDVESTNLWKEKFLTVWIEAKDIDNSEINWMQDWRIFYYWNKNWWSRVWEPSKMPIGEPWGWDSEMFYDLWIEHKFHENSPFKDQQCHVNCDCWRFVEIGNNVFMEYIRTEKWYEQLPKKNVDCWCGFERMVMVVQGKINIYDTDLFSSFIKKIEKLSWEKHNQKKSSTISMRIIAEHTRAFTFILWDDKWIVPSNTDQWYIVRRLIRRTIRHGKKLNIIQKDWLIDLCKIVIEEYKDVYPELERNQNFILSELQKEEERFKKTLEKWEKMISGKSIDWYMGFNLFQTYGYPVELTKEIALEKWITLSSRFDEEFNNSMQQHQNLSRTASVWKFKWWLADQSEETTKLHTASHLLLAALRKVLWNHVYQKWSNITSERLRYDFSHPEKLSLEQIQRIENLVNKAISDNLSVSWEELPLKEAKNKWAIGVFENKYEWKVKVYKIGEGDNIFSYEICWGPHVDNTWKLWQFKIIKEESSSANVRRIKAILE